MNTTVPKILMTEVPINWFNAMCFHFSKGGFEPRHNIPNLNDVQVTWTGLIESFLEEDIHQSPVLEKKRARDPFKG